MTVTPGLSLTDPTRSGHRTESGNTPSPILESVAGRDDLAAMAVTELTELAGAIRRFLIQTVCAAGGHLGVNLGVVELTIALHRVFTSPRDALLFDTGHQSYVHKILTGRQAGFTGLRQAGGLSGYPSRAESEHDWVENSHASTALSYADGLAKGFALRGEHDRRVVAVIGDGALTGGLAWEGLNNLAGSHRPVIVVLNDNGRSYAPTVGGIATQLAELADRGGAGPGRKRSLFEALGFAYIGPVDGHDVEALEAALGLARQSERPVVVHVRTSKGKGYQPAENHELDHMHAVGVIDPATGRSPAGSSPGASPSWTSVFAHEAVRIGDQRTDVVAITAAMLEPVGLGPFATAFPDRTFDVGIAEQHATCSAAGLAMAGLHPLVCIYSTFLNRAYDQLLLDVALHELPVTFVLDRSGITGPDGPSHHGMWDTALAATVPGLQVAAPRDPTRLRELLGEAVSMPGPTMIRFPKGPAPADLPAVSRMDGVDILYYAKNRPLDVLLVSAGAMAGVCLEAAEALHAVGLGVTVADPRWFQPVNPFLVHLAARHRALVTAEDAPLAGGLGSQLRSACAEAGISLPIRTLGLPRAFLPHASRTDLLANCGLSAQAITEAIADTARQPSRSPS